MRYTKVKAKQNIEAHKDNTAFYDGTLTEEEVYNMLRYRMRFGEAETQVIISSLVISGAKFKI